MTNSKMRKILLVCCAAVAIVLIAPTASQACECLDRLMPWNWCKPKAPVATYAPAYTVQYPCATQTCNYVPRTSYRTVLRTAPTTVYRPVSYCDPCTGCARTTYRPITSYVRSAQLVPYTTYRPVWTSSCYASCATPCATTCGTACGTSCGTACGTSYGTTTYSTPSSGCSSCAPAPATTIPATTTLAPTPMPGATTTQTQPPNNTAPAIPQNVPTQKFQQNKPIKPVPEKEVPSNPTSGPQLNGPSIDRMTARPVRQATYQPVSNRTSTPTFSYDGWRASSK